jgi:2-phosphoglycerate kinase
VEHPTVFVILGPSSSGKSTLAREIGLQWGVPWMQADDLRLALSVSQAQTSSQGSSFYFDRVVAEMWTSQEPGFLCARMVETAETMQAGLRIIIENHLEIGEPLIVEGDCIHPALAPGPGFVSARASGRLKFCCLRFAHAEELRSSILGRDRGLNGKAGQMIDSLVRFHWQYATWLETECSASGIPLVDCMPRITLRQRVQSALDQ